MKTKTKIAGAISDAISSITNWRPFDLKPLHKLMFWFHDIRRSDQAWGKYLAEKYKGY